MASGPQTKTPGASFFPAGFPAPNFGDFTKIFADMKMPAMPDMEAFIAANRRNIEAITAANRIALEGAQAVDECPRRRAGLAGGVHVVLRHDHRRLLDLYERGHSRDDERLGAFHVDLDQLRRRTAERFVHPRGLHLDVVRRSGRRVERRHAVIGAGIAWHVHRRDAGGF